MNLENNQNERGSEDEEEDEDDQLDLQSVESNDAESEAGEDEDRELGSSDDDENMGNREDYDIRQNVDHPYLHEQAPDEPSTSCLSFQEPEPRTCLNIPVFFLPSVVLPGQSVPLTGEAIPEEVLKNALKQKYPYIGVLTADFRHGLQPNIGTGVLVQVSTLTQRENGSFSLVGNARQRFRLTRSIEETEIETGTLNSALFYVEKVEVEVLDERLLFPFEYDHCCAYNRFMDKWRTMYLKNVYSIHPMVIQFNSTENAVKLLTKWLCLFLDVTKINRAFERGLSMFSFWVASNLPISPREKLEILEESSVDRRLMVELHYIKELSRLGCHCGSEKMNVDDLINLNSEAMGNCYVNPYGYVHDMFTSRNAENISFSGHAQTEFSWFAGYSWTIMNCANCGMHIGWMFKSKKLKPAKFYGINRSAIKPIRKLDDDEA